MKSSIKILSIVMGMVFSAQSQNLSVQSSIYDQEDQKPLWGTSVRVLGSSKGTLTDQSGKFKLSGLDAQDSISIHFVGYASQQFLASEVPSKISLEKLVVLNDEVVVNALMANSFSPMAFTNVGKEELKKQNLGQDIPLLLNFLPSMVTTSDAGAGIGYTGIRIRGTDPTRINVTINGIPLNDSESQGLYWVNMPDMASSVSNIQVQRGVGTSTNGASAFGGSVHVNTNQYEPNSYAEIASSGGSFNTLKNTLKLGTGLFANRFTFDLRLSQITSDGYIDRASSDLKSLYSTLGYFGKKSIIRLNYFTGKEITYQSWYGTPESRVNNDVDGMIAFITRNPLSEAERDNLFESGRTYNFYTYENQVDNYAQDHYQLLTHHDLGGNWDMDINLHYTYGRGYYEEFKNYPDLRLYGIYAKIFIENLVRRKWLDNDFYGSTYHFHYDNKKGFDWVIGGAWNKYVGRHFGRIIAPEVIQNIEWYRSLSHKRDFNLYSKMNLALTDQLIGFLDLQGRFIRYSTKGTKDYQIPMDIKESFSFFNPKIGLNYQVGETARLYGSLARGAKEPSRNDFVDNLTNTPRPEKLTDIELGYEVNGKGYQFQANAYWMNYTDQLVLTGRLNDVGEAIRENVAKSYRLGIELIGGFQLSKHFAWVGNLTLSSNKVEDYQEVVFDYENYQEITIQHKKTDIAYSPSLIGSSQLKFMNKGFEVNLNTKYVGEQYLDNTSSRNRMIPAYWTQDILVQKTIPAKWAKELRLNLMVNNLFNRMYSSNGYTWGYIYGERVIENFYYPQAGLNFLGGLTIRI